MKIKKQKTKIRISIIISVISICIAILSLSYAVYKDFRDYKTANEIKQLQIRGANFDETYKKISLAEQNLIDKINSCDSDELNKENIKSNMQLLIDARQAVIGNNNDLALTILSNMKDVCVAENPPLIPANLQKTLGVSIIIIIWLILIIAFLRINYKRK